MICFADWGMRGELARIWETCFQEPPRPAKFFLNNRFRPQNCLVYHTTRGIASVVYLLPVSISTGKKPVQAHYIYAAATLPAYRGRGYMAALLAAAALVGAKRGDQYSAVLPATPQLYGFYQRADYTPFFKVSHYTVSRETMRTLANPGGPSKVLFTYQQLNSVRNEALLRRTGSVLWSDASFAFAQGMGKVYGDRMICARSGNRPAYAFCRRTEQNSCLILELMAGRDTMRNLAAGILNNMPAEQYIFRLPAFSTLGRKGSVTDFGMIKPIGGSTIRQIGQDTDMPYLGLPLD
ncbi:GNAT family N-acetyltransferase [Caproiciproducens galactitolivorans]|uniref:GNAT family N-acetyltransferase n=1 Tax=Caproiciproducens galactitolivorans TaxID=642589 RepID=A0ABT4BSY4_9FIRM|nr:GNAT family N-acetyltransferase [Caproiciproducens galactitolivorans]MCY1713997.1 GNAT family N-acetyltransferase [Caproiciproducens galactitolivorans]